MTTYLGIDYGKKNLGLALADGPLARPITTLSVASAKDSLPAISRLVAANQVSTIVLGLPGGTLDQEIRSFGNTLTKLTGVKVVYHEETLSTYEAQMALRSAGAPRTRLANDHVYAACIILEDYLESLK